MSIAHTPNAHAGELAGPYIKPEYQTGLEFGQRSHWVQPWRGYLETMPAAHFVNGTGMVLNGIGNTGENIDLVVQHLAKSGIKHGRLELSWSEIPWAENQINNPNAAELLRACQRWGIRPLILLNANHGVPGPHQFFERTVTAAAPQGTRTVQLNDVSGLVIGKSGFRNLTDYKATEVIVTAINGNSVTLSKPLPVSFNAGQNVPMATMKYAPFAAPGTPSSIETTNGWKKYVELVAQFARTTLAAGAGDKDFDLEIWNEMSFGSDFLDINRYYDPPIAVYPDNNPDINHEHLVNSTAQFAEANGTLFQNVQLVDGFPNTTPWRGAGNQPTRVTALSKHPYSGQATYPQDEPGGTPINALGQVDTSGWKPSYSRFFPEYYGTAIQTEHMVRDMSPLSTEFYGRWKHGRYSRGTNSPVWAWMTEIGTIPSEIGITDPATQFAIKGKAAGRYLTFFLGKGVQRLYFYSASAGDNSYGVVRDSFLQYTRTNSTYPADDSAWISPALLVTRRLTEQMKIGMDANLTLANTRQITVNGISDTHNNRQFAGDGTAARPDLFNRELLCITPFQVNSKKFVIPYYVMTRDIRNSLAPERYTIDFGGLKGTGAKVSIYDPTSGVSTGIPVEVKAHGASRLQVEVEALDTPRLLIVEEDALVATQPIANGLYKVIARHSGKALTIAGGVTATQNGAKAVQWQNLSNAGDNFKWQITWLNNGYYKLIAKHSDKALDVSGVSLQDGAHIQQWSYADTNNQQWQIEAVGDGFYKLLARHSGKALDVSGISNDDGAQIHQWTYLGGHNQQWRFEPTTSGVIANGTGLKGEYFSGVNFNTLVKTQTDPQINFDWGNGSPQNVGGGTMSSVGPDNFSVRWTGQVQAVEGGVYTFTTTTDDGARLWVNGTLIIDKWLAQAPTAWSGTISLSAGQKVNIKLEYYEAGSGAAAKLNWTRPGQASQIIPQIQLYPTTA